MLADPQNITPSVGAKVANRTLTGTSLGRFVAGDGSVTLEVQTAPGARIRTVARLVENKVAADPLTALNSRYGQTIALTINRPMDGFSEADVLTSVKAFITWLTANTDANLKKIIAGEN